MQFTRPQGVVVRRYSQRKRYGPVVAVWLALTGACAAQQLILFGSNEFELTAPQVNEVSSTVRSRLEQTRALVADERWDEAADALREIATEEPDRVVPLDEGHFVSLPTYCQMQLSTFPPEGLAAYRRRVDAAAEAAYRSALAQRDPVGLARVAEEYFCSTWGDDALAACGELALERGDYGTARGAWLATSPVLRDPRGRPEWLALYDVDLARHGPAVQERWQGRDRPAHWLAYPDSDFDPAAVRARLVLVSIREGDLARAALELDVLRSIYPEAVGRLGGRTERYVSALERLLELSRRWPAESPTGDWPTFAGADTRNGIARALGPLVGPAWNEPVSLPPVDVERAPVLSVFGQLSRFEPRPAVPVRESDQPLTYFPVVADGYLYFSDGRSIRAVELASGEPALTPDGVLYRLDGTRESERLGGASVAAGVPRNTLTVADNVLYARLGEHATSRIEPPNRRTEERLVGLNLARDAVLTVQIRPDDGRWSFDGAPLVREDRVYVAMRQSDARPGAYVACFDAATGRRRWRTFLGAADTRGAGRGDEITCNLLTLSGNCIYANTNLGLVAALDASDGRLRWLRRYDRAAGKFQRPGPIHFDREPSPCLYDRGLVFVAPADSPLVFALDADTGMTVWSTDRLAGAMHLLGVVDGTLVADGRQLWALDARSGRVRFVWPESEHAGVRGFGRGVIAGSEVFWPTRDKIYSFDLHTGERTREPIELGTLSDCGANLLVAEGRIIVVAKDRMMAWGTKLPKPAADDGERVESVAMNASP